MDLVGGSFHFLVILGLAQVGLLLLGVVCVLPSLGIYSLFENRLQWQPGVIAARCLAFVLNVIPLPLIGLLFAALILALADSAGPWGMLVFSILGLFSLVCVTADNAERRNQLETDYLGLAEYRRYEILLSCLGLPLFVLALLFPALVINPPVHAMVQAIIWLDDIPILSWIVNLAGFGFALTIMLKGAAVVVASAMSLLGKFTTKPSQARHGGSPRPA